MVNKLDDAEKNIKSLKGQVSFLNENLNVEKKTSNDYKVDTLIVYKNQRVIDSVFNEIVVEKEKIVIKLVDTTIINTVLDTVTYPNKVFALDSNDLYIRGIIKENTLIIDTLAVKTTLKLNVAKRKGVLFNTYSVYPETGKLQITNSVNIVSYKKDTKFTKCVKVIMPVLAGSFVTFLIMK